MNFHQMKLIKMKSTFWNKRVHQFYFSIEIGFFLLLMMIYLINKFLNKF